MESHAVTDSNNVNDSEVIANVLAGDIDEFGTLVEAYENQIYAMIMRQIANPNIARELTQETFLRAYRHLGKFRGDSSFSTWLTRIALNRTNSYFTSKQYRQSKKTVDFKPEHETKVESKSQQIPFSPELIARLRGLIAELSPKYRDTITLCVLEEKTYQAAADILEVPLGTVASRMNKAVHLLREKLKGETI